MLRKQILILLNPKSIASGLLSCEDTHLSQLFKTEADLFDKLLYNRRQNDKNYPLH